MDISTKNYPQKEHTKDDDTIVHETASNSAAAAAIRRTALWSTIACGAGLFSDGYLNAAISPVSTILRRIYGDAFTYNKNVTNLNAIVFAGTILGQLFFGFASDHWSRTGSLMASTVILIFFAILSAGAYSGGTVDGMIMALTAYRFFVGIGIGGEYPAGSVGAAEHSGSLRKGTRNRWFILFTNVMIDFGFVMANMVALIVVRITTDNHLRAAWRIVLGIGALPPFILFFLRLKLKEPEPYKHEKMTLAGTPWLLAVRFYWFRWLLVALIWFIYDLCAYSFGIFSTPLVDSLFKSSGGNSDELWQSLGWGTLINFFYMPGAIAGSFSSDWIGPKYTLIIGVLLQAIFGFAMAAQAPFFFQSNHVAGFCIMYGLFLCFGEFGPGDNIGLMASKTCASSVRGKYYGMAAAVGKLGAFVGQYIFRHLQERAGNDMLKGNQNQFWLGGALAVFSALLALMLPNIDQEVVAQEDIRFRRFLEEHGYDTSRMGMKDVVSVGTENDYQIPKKELQ